MLSLFKSPIAHRITGGFFVGALAILTMQPPEGALSLIATMKAAAGIA